MAFHGTDADSHTGRFIDDSAYYKSALAARIHLPRSARLPAMMVDLNRL
jgi:hypothetical protein